jgi:hypothetical protein
MEQREEWAAVTRAALHQRRIRRLQAIQDPMSVAAASRLEAIQGRRAHAVLQARAQRFAHLRAMHD